MAQDDAMGTLKGVLLASAVVQLFYGFVLLFIPATYLTFTGANTVELGWLRWPGGILIAVGIGTYRVSHTPAKQDVFVTTVILGNLLAGLAMLYTWLAGEYSGNTVSIIAAPTVITLAIAALLWWARGKVKNIL
jgi:hypothetical protein